MGLMGKKITYLCFKIHISQNIHTHNILFTSLSKRGRKYIFKNLFVFYYFCLFACTDLHSLQHAASLIAICGILVP